VHDGTTTIQEIKRAMATAALAVRAVREAA